MTISRLSFGGPHDEGRAKRTTRGCATEASPTTILVGGGGFLGVVAAEVGEILEVSVEGLHPMQQKTLGRCTLLQAFLGSNLHSEESPLAVP